MPKKVNCFLEFYNSHLTKQHKKGSKYWSPFSKILKTNHYLKKLDSHTNHHSPDKNHLE